MKIIELAKLPGAVTLAAKVFCASLSKPGVTASCGWRDVMFVRPSVIVDEKKVRQYAKICGYTEDQGVPPLLPHIEAFPLAMMLFASDHFPFRAMGIIHLANRVSQHQRINVGDELRIEVQSGDLYTHGKGQVMTLHARALREKVVVWDSSWTLLRPGITKPVGADYASVLPEGPPLFRLTNIPATSGTSRRYAMVSGDVNPIHLGLISARVMGLRRAIAHGMWTKARALALLTPLSAVGRCDVHVEFRSPLYLPAAPELWVSQSASGTNFEVRNASGDRTYMRGYMTLNTEGSVV